MADAATMLQHERLTSPETTGAGYRLLDDMPEFRITREAARHEALNIVEANRQQLIEGNFDTVPIPVDALGTARKALETRDEFGADSLEFVERYEGLVLDCQRLLGEAARKNTYEYFPKVRQVFDEETGEYHSHGMSILKMTEAGLTPIAQPEELDRRVNERVEEVSCTIGRFALARSMTIRTVSECPDWAIDAYGRKSKAGWGGYVPEINKLVVRDISYDPMSDDRFEEQVALSGEFITHEVVTEALARKRIMAEGMTKTDLHGAQIAANDDLLDFIPVLDQVASERSGLDIFMGEVVATGEVKDYDKVREEAALRQQNMEKKAQELAGLVMKLEEAGTDKWAAVGMVENKVKKMLLELAGRDLDIASTAFDEKTRQGLESVAYLRTIGLARDANILLAQVEQAAPAPGYCGAGNCGLENVDIQGEEGKKLKKLLHAEEGDIILKDKERVCKCGQKDIVYAYNKKKVNKYCESCGAFESK